MKFEKYKLVRSDLERWFKKEVEYSGEVDIIERRDKDVIVIFINQ